MRKFALLALLVLAGAAALPSLIEAHYDWWVLPIALGIVAAGLAGEAIYRRAGLANRRIPGIVVVVLSLLLAVAIVLVSGSPDGRVFDRISDKLAAADQPPE